MKINDAIFGAVLILLGAVVLVHVQSFPQIPGQQVGPALFPGLVAVGLAVCGVLLVVTGLRARRGEASAWLEVAGWTTSPRHALAFVLIIGGVAVYALFAQAVGFLLLAPVLLLVWFLVLGVRPVSALVISIAATLVIWYAFYKLLRVPLPWGWLTPHAF